MALGKRADHFVPARMGGICPLCSDLPLVRPKRSACVAIASRFGGNRRAKSCKVVKRTIVIGKRRCPSLARDPVHLRACACIEDLLARQSRRSRTMAERKAADEHLRRVARDAIRLRVGEAPAESPRVGGACPAQGLHQVRLCFTRGGAWGGGGG